MENNEVAGNGFISRKYGLSWIVYVKMLISHAIFIAIIVYSSSFSTERNMILVCFFLFETIVIFFTFLSMRARYVFINERGVWYHRGILPWTKGCNGIIWNDCGGSLYKQGFFAYILNTYTIYITHKYTESMQIAISDIYKGKEFCGIVQDYLHALQKRQ